MISKPRQVLFVDDEAEFLSSLDDLLGSMDPGWQVRRAQSGREALEILAKGTVDVIVSDLYMPDMDGGDLLQKVMDRHPQVLRFLMSGRVHRDDIPRLALTAHQCFYKPFDPEELKLILRRLSALRDLLSNDTLRRLVNQCSILPTTPTLYLELARELQADSPSFERAESVISRDPSLASKILQLVNSAYLGLPRKISSLQEAILLVGIDLVRSLALCLPVFARFEALDGKEFSVAEIWNHSWRTALAARKIGLLEQQDSAFCESSFIAGLPHEVGRLVLMCNLPSLCRDALLLSKTPGIQAWQAEKEVFGCTQAMVGGYLLSLWGLPETVVEAVALHDQPMDSPTNLFSPLTAVHVANAIDLAIHRAPSQPVLDCVDVEYLISLGLHPRLEFWHSSCLPLFSKTHNE